MPREREECRACHEGSTYGPICGNCRKKLPIDLRERLRYAKSEGDEFEMEAAVLAALDELS